MPGPGRGKAKSKSKSKAPQNGPSLVIPNSFIADIDNAEGWTVLVNILCDFFSLPDLSTRSGLKKVHADFEAIYRRLDKAYQKNADNEKFRGGIVGIYAKMCTDSILRDKLFEKGFLSSIMPLLDVPSCRHLTLVALSNVTHHGGISARTEVARRSHILVKLLQDHGADDPKLAELAIVTLVHAVGAVAGTEEPGPDQKLLDSLDMPTILRVVTESVREPKASHYLISHALDFLAICTLNCPDACKAYPSMIRLLVAVLRSNDLITRCTALGGLIRLHRKESELDRIQLDPMKMMASMARGFPTHLSEVMMNYGPARCDTTLTLKTTVDYQKAMMKCAQDHNLYSLGLTLAQFILRTEFSIADGMFQSENPVTGQPESIDVGLPFVRWGDALSHCAAAIRDSGNSAEVYLADILQLKFLIMKHRIAEAVEYAKNALTHNQHAYFYYAITLTANGNDGLRSAKKGLKCKNTSPFVKFQMMHRAVEHAGDMGITILQRSPSVGDKKWEEGVAFLSSALEDAKNYVEQAPPDNRHMKSVFYWYILLTLTLRGSETSEDLRELEGAFKKLQTADDFSNFLGVPPPKTNLRLAQQEIVKLYPTAVKEWGRVISRFDTLATAPQVDTSKAQDDLAAWLDDCRMEDGEEGPERCTHRAINTNNVELYRCSWCRNPSAALRKCSGCNKTRYCDGACQKSHWGDHKKTCGTK